MHHITLFATTHDLTTFTIYEPLRLVYFFHRETSGI